VSLDGAKSWTKWPAGFPTVPVMDLVIHPREQDLVIGTFGRAAYILDDLRPLRALAASGAGQLDEPLLMFDPPEAYLAITGQAAGTRFTGEAEFKGENRPYGALLTFVYNPAASKDEAAAAPEKRQAEEPEKEPGEEREAEQGGAGKGKKKKVKLEVLDGGGTVIRTQMHEVEPGVNRVAWELTRSGVRSPSEAKPAEKDAPEPEGHKVLPGEYRVRLSSGDLSQEKTVRVLPDPRIEDNREEFEARQLLLLEIQAATARATAAVDKLRDSRETIDLVMGRLGDDEGEQTKALKKSGEELKKTIDGLMELINQKEVQGILRDPAKVSARLYMAAAYADSEWGTPGETGQLALAQARQSLDEALLRIDGFMTNEWPAYRRQVEAAAVSFFKTY